MIFFKSIYNFFNKNIVEDFNKIYAEKKAAIDTFFDRSSIFSDDKCIINGDFKKQINDCVTLIKHLFKNHKHGVFTFKEKKYLVQNIDYISKLYNLYCIQKIEFESFNKLQKLCPNAVNLYCKNNSIPAERRQLYREHILSHSADLRKLEPILVEQIQHEQLMSTFKNEIEENFLRNLYYKQYFVNITTDNEKKKILSSLEKLDYYCCYNEIILKQPVLNYFLSEFCKEYHIDEKDYQQCCEKLNLLRTFAFEQLEIRYNNIERKYKKDVELFRKKSLNKEIMPKIQLLNLFQPSLSSQNLIRLKRDVEKNERENNEQPKLEQERLNKLFCIQREYIIKANHQIREEFEKIFRFDSNKPCINNKNEIDVLLDRKENEQAKLEEGKKRREEERKRIIVRNLTACVSNWNTPVCSHVKYFSLYYYYPTNCDWEANNAEWNVRNIIWNFKASPNKPTNAFTIMRDHQEAVNKIIPDLVKLFNHTFGNSLSQLTLVCIPSSKAAVTERRYKDFSEKLCKITNMDNAYNFIHVTADGEAKHLGGNKTAQLSFDNNYFNGRNIVLFDDVITYGNSIEILKRKLEQMGAYVVCAVTIGETMHKRLFINPIDMLLLLSNKNKKG